MKVKISQSYWPVVEVLVVRYIEVSRIMLEAGLFWKSRQVFDFICIWSSRHLQHPQQQTHQHKMHLKHSNTYWPNLTINEASPIITIWSKSVTKNQRESCITFYVNNQEIKCLSCIWRWKSKQKKEARVI